MTEQAQRGADLRIAVLVPCRNEGAVIERKLLNLLWVRWPGEPSTKHSVVIVDDGSNDGTSDRARAVAQEMAGAPGPEIRVVPNTQTPGKAGAMRSGIEAVGDSADLLVLTDADVILRETALVALAGAFVAHPDLGLACGAQEFVRDLAHDGRPRSASGSDPVRTAGIYDRWTDRVRAFESARGCLFSLHGQLAAWLVSSGLAPTPGVAADDLDLMLQVRARGLRVERIASARFLEVKTPAGPARGRQAVRRARAYFQVLDRHGMPPAHGLFQRAQSLCYRFLPEWAPRLAILSCTALCVLAGVRYGLPGAAIAGLVLAVASLLGPGRRLVRLLRVIATARSLERDEPLSDRWEMERG